MNTYSFDVFDTCLVRKCGAAVNLFDILSYKVFTEQVTEADRQEFVARRKAAQNSLWERNDYQLEDIYNAFKFCHPALRCKEELLKLELECEEMVLLPVMKIKDFITKLHREGNRLLFISDMYLPYDFILSILKRYGFYQDGDKLYVSNQTGCLKSTGELFRWVKETEHLSYSHWEHWGDNKKGDYSVPKRLGIRCHLVNQIHTPYSARWAKHSHSLGIDYAGIAAGLSNALRCTLADNEIKDFDLDIVAPYYCSFVHRVLTDAAANHIQRLYFCARDTYQLFQIAKEMGWLFPSIELKYLYISKKALYNGDDVAKLKYFEQIGLATRSDNVAIFDIRSSGHTLQYLNKILESNNYSKIRGYFFELFTDREISYNLDNYYCELNNAYHYNNARVSGLMGCWHLYESFFSMNKQQRTIDYSLVNGEVEPVFATKEDVDEECRLVYDELQCNYHTQLLLDYTKSYIQLKLTEFNDKIFEEIAIPTLASFFHLPEKHYLPPLEHFFGFHANLQRFVPYVKQESIVSLLKTKGRDSMWRKGTVVYSLPKWVVPLLIILKE